MTLLTVDFNNIWSTLMQSGLHYFPFALVSWLWTLYSFSVSTFWLLALLWNSAAFSMQHDAPKHAKAIPPVAADLSLLHQIEWDSLPRGVANHGQCFNEIRAAVITSFPHVAALLSLQTSVLVSKCRPIYKLCEGASARDCCTNGRSCNKDPIPSFCYR